MNNTFTNKQEFEQYFLYNLDRAIDEGWIKAYHHPLIRAASGFISDEEAFARWEDPELGIFVPNDFIPVLERENLTYKLDLYMVERVLSKMKGQDEHGIFVVPESVNLGRSDFYSCDMVQEIIDRIDKSGLSRDKLSVELSEKTIDSDVDFFKGIVERFQKAGIKVWMDNYGSGYSSLLILLKIKFNLLKVDKTFVDTIIDKEASASGRIILTELIKTAMSLGMDTVAEGVETKEQVDFLTEIGCTKLQGFFYTKPLSLADIIKSSEKGFPISFENPDESDYFEQLGKVNLYDLSISRNDDDSLDNYFDTMPMAILSFSKTKAKYVRTNYSYKKFIETRLHPYSDLIEYDYDSITPGPGYYSFNCMRQCARDGKRLIIDDRFGDGCNVQLFIRRVAENPITEEAAIAMVILSVSDTDEDDNLNFNYIARALSSDYLNLYFVNMDTDEFTEYATNGDNHDMTVVQHGTDYFNLTKNTFDFPVTDEDKPALLEAFTKEKIAQEIAKHGVFSIVTRINQGDDIIYVSVKAVEVRGNGNYIIVGTRNVDDEMKARDAISLAKEQNIIYSRIGALMGDLIYIYTVDLETSAYTRYSPLNIISDMDMPPEGDDFFNKVIERIPYGIYEEDVDASLTAFSKEKVLNKIRTQGVFENRHRLKTQGKAIYVNTRAVILVEDGKEKLIIGIVNIDEQVRKEKEYEEHIFAVENKANIDELTGVKNKHAYADVEHKMDAQISQKKKTTFAVAVFDINDLKQVNDLYGHQAGDKYIKDGCAIICNTFKHSPVFRIGGDEFAVVIQGSDYKSIDSIMQDFHVANLQRKNDGDVVIAAGTSKFDSDESVARVFERADAQMYENKKALKA